MGCGRKNKILKINRTKGPCFPPRRLRSCALSELQLPACTAAAAAPRWRGHRPPPIVPRQEQSAPRVAGEPAPIGLRGGGRCRGQSGAWRVVRSRRALVLPLPSAGRAAPAGDGGAGLSFSAGNVFRDGTGPGRGTGRAGGRERGKLGKGRMAVGRGWRCRLRSLLPSLTASRSSSRPVAGGLSVCRARGRRAEPRGLAAAGLSAPPLRERSA